MPLTWVLRARDRKTFQDFAKNVPNPFRPEPLTSPFVIRACPVGAPCAVYRAWLGLRCGCPGSCRG